MLQSALKFNPGLNSSLRHRAEIFHLVKRVILLDQFERRPRLDMRMLWLRFHEAHRYSAKVEIHHVMTTIFLSPFRAEITTVLDRRM